MKVRYKQNGEDMLYDPVCLPVVPRQPQPVLTGPFPRCHGCPYPGHGFVCGDEEACIRTEMARIRERDRSVQ